MTYITVKEKVVRHNFEWIYALIEYKICAFITERRT